MLSDGKFILRWNQGFCGAMENYTLENLNSFFHKTNDIILNYHKALQSYVIRQPPLQDNHLSKTTNAESTQPNSRTIVTL